MAKWVGTDRDMRVHSSAPRQPRNKYPNGPRRCLKWEIWFVSYFPLLRYIDTFIITFLFFDFFGIFAKILISHSFLHRQIFSIKTLLLLAHAATHLSLCSSMMQMSHNVPSVHKRMKMEPTGEGERREEEWGVYIFCHLWW